MSSLALDLRYACRTLRKSPGFTLVAIVTLALSLGANTAIFSFVNAVLLEPLPYADSDRIMRVLEAPPGGGRNGISTLNYLDWEKQNTCFDFMAARTGGSAALTGIDEPVQLPGNRVSPHFFDIYGVKAALGRTFADGEDQAGKDHVAVLSHSLWQSQFGGAPGIVGRTILLDGEPHTVIGVLPKDTPFERGGTRLWRPLTFTPANMTRNFHWFGAVARLKPGVTLEQARAQMDAIGKRIAADFPDSNKGWSVGVDRLADTIIPPQLSRALYVVLATVGMVLLIACANLANLSLMRVVGREREIAIRAALGAGRWALVRQFLTESLLLSLIGGALGLVVGQLTMTWLKVTMPPNALPSDTVEVSLNGRVLLFSFVLAVLTGVVIGLFPALQAARANLTNALKQGGGGTSAGGSHTRMRSGLVVAEIALAFVLLTSAGLLIRSLDHLSRVDPGFDATNVLTFRLPVSDKRLPDPAGLNSYLREIGTRLRALPGVTDVALTSALPMQGWGYGMPFQIADRPTVDRSNRKACFFKMVSASYFHTLGIRLRQGRTLADTDLHGTPPVTVINEAMAKQQFPGENPIGKRILVQEIVPGKTQLGDEIPWEVVGVVADEKVGGLEDISAPLGMYVSNEQSANYGQAVLIRSATDTALLREAAKKAVHEISRDQVLPGMRTLDDIKTQSLGNSRFLAMLLGIFAGISLLLAAVGIYGVISYSMTQRTREIGIRMALGASRGNILRLVLGHGLTLTLLGLLLGVGGALGLTQLLASLLFGVGGRDPLTMAVVAGILGLVALLACLLPARRSTKVNPLIALRCE